MTEERLSRANNLSNFIEAYGVVIERYCNGLKANENRLGSALIDINKYAPVHIYEYLMVHPNRETYYLFIDNWTQEVVRIYVNELLNGDYYIGKFDTVFVNKKMIEFYKRMIQCHENRIKKKRNLNE